MKIIQVVRALCLSSSLFATPSILGLQNSFFIARAETINGEVNNEIRSNRSMENLERKYELEKKLLNLTLKYNESLEKKDLLNDVISRKRDELKLMNEWMKNEDDSIQVKEYLKNLSNEEKLIVKIHKMQEKLQLNETELKLVQEHIAKNTHDNQNEAFNSTLSNKMIPFKKLINYEKQLFMVVEKLKAESLIKLEDELKNLKVVTTESRTRAIVFNAKEIPVLEFVRNLSELKDFLKGDKVLELKGLNADLRVLRKEISDLKIEINNLKALLN